jgi:hypothetical protein
MEEIKSVNARVSEMEIGETLVLLLTEWDSAMTAKGRARRRHAPIKTKYNMYENEDGITFTIKRMS